MSKPVTPAEDRFDKKVVIDDSGCWLWIAAKNRDGYGRFEGTLAHRWSYEHHRGPIPDDLHLDHLCRVRSCVNPDHLEAVSKSENNRRSESLPAKNARKTHCKKGHLFDEANTLIKVLKRGTERSCRRCHADQAAKSRREM